MLFGLIKFHLNLIMFDPMTQAFTIPNIFSWYRNYEGKLTFHILITIWHNDPCKDGSDDSCGWFMRARHGNKEVLEKIIKKFNYDWENTFTSDTSGKIYQTGLFHTETKLPNFSVFGVVLNLFFIAAIEHFQSDGNTNWKKSKKFLRKHLLDIMLFAENPIDSLHDSLTFKFGNDIKREERIKNVASCIYSWILREQRPWYKHPKWHLWHWKIQFNFIQNIKRKLASKNVCEGAAIKKG